MKYMVNLTLSAEDDIFEIYKYLYLNDSENKAEKLYTELNEKYLTLKQFPHRDHMPSELSLIGIDELLEITYKPYRIIYQIIEEEVFIHCILDGRRDIQKLLQERLVRE